MDRSLSSSSGTGDLNCCHHQYRQTVRNSTSPSFLTNSNYYNEPQHQQLWGISATSPAPSSRTPVLKPQTGVPPFNIPLGQERSFAARNPRSTEVHQNLVVVPSQGSGYVGSFFEKPNPYLSVQQCQQRSPQSIQQHYSPQGQLGAPTDFVTSGVINSKPNCYGSHISSGSQNRSRSEQVPYQPRVSGSPSTRNCGQQLQQQVDGQRSTQQQSQILKQSTFSGNNTFSATTFNKYSSGLAARGHHQEELQARLGGHQYSSVSRENHPSSPVVSISTPGGVQMSNNQQYSSASSRNMNKNRYGPETTTQPQSTTPIRNVSMPQSMHDNINSQATSNNVKQLLIQQTTQEHQQQQKINEINNETSSTIPRPQYRIFKRGDSIPGISSPIQISALSTSTNHTSVEAVGTRDNAGGSNVTQNGLGGSDTISNKEDEDANFNGASASDKENKNLFKVTPVLNVNNSSSNGYTLNSGSNGGNGPGPRTPLSQIGEIARFHGLSISYRLVKETGPPHAPTFTVVLQLGNEEYTGEGTSIKKAQHAVATQALEKTSLVRPPPRSRPKKTYNVIGGGGGTGSKRPNWALIQLTNLAQELQLQLQFVQQPVPIVDPFRRGDPPSMVSVHVGDRIFSGEGSNFNAAKTMAVMIALKAMLKVKQEADIAKLSQVGGDESLMDGDNKSPISIVHEMAMKRGLPVSFDIVQESGPPHMKVFTVNCKVGEDLQTEGQGPTKQAAKKASSELMIAKLKEIPIMLPATSQGANLKAIQRGLLRQKSTKKKTSTPVLKDLEKQVISPISRLIQIAHMKKFKEPEFTLVSTGTESNVETFLQQITERDRRMLRKKKPSFTMEVAVGPYHYQGIGPNKKAAKKAAAEAAIIGLGYGATEDHSLNDGVGSSQPSIVTTSTTSDDSKPESKEKSEEKTSVSSVKFASTRQIAPGVIILKRGEPASGAATATVAVQETNKVVSMMSPCPAVNSREGIEKLAYLSRLLEISVSYSDFPKKNEYLSVVSLTTNPPHVAHGCGTTLEEAQNAAALKILEELSTRGLDSVTAQEPSES